MGVITRRSTRPSLQLGNRNLRSSIHNNTATTTTVSSRVVRLFGDDQGSLALMALSRLLGWIYTLAWSASFYPQVIHNHVERSTVGLSSDFVVLNAVGHLSYLMYNSLLFFYEPVRRAYRKRHGGRENVVQWNDWVFSAHASLLALLTLGQYLAYRKTPEQHVSRPVRLALALILTVGVFMLGAKQLKLVGWLHLVATCSTIKLLITLTKYLPQIQLNTTRKTTQGFTIQNILLDLTGGLLSLLQLIVDSVLIQKSWSGVTGDWAKLGLSLLSIAFDLILIWQHYVLYPPKHQHQHQQVDNGNDYNNDDDDDDHHHDDRERAGTSQYGTTSTSSQNASAARRGPPPSRAPPSVQDDADESTSLLR